MIARNKIKWALKFALDAKDPKDENKERHIITWPMVNFRHAIKPIADLQPVKEVSFVFSEEDIQKQLTTAIFKTTDRTIRFVYDYHTDTVDCIAIGKDLDPVKRTINVNEVVDFAKEFFPIKKRIVIVKKRNV